MYPHTNPRAAQKGLSLVELMLAITLGLVLTAGVLQVVMSTKQSFNTQQALARVQENARLVMDALVADISAAGYMGCLPIMDVDNKANVAVTNTLADQTMNYDFQTPVAGTEGGGANPDTLTVRRASESSAVPMVESLSAQNAETFKVDSGHPNYTSLKQWDVVSLSDCSHASVFLITNDPQDGATPGVIAHKADVTAPADSANGGQKNASSDLGHPYSGNFNRNSARAKIYKVGSTVYALKSTRNGVALPTPSLFAGEVELAQGVEDLQIQYGIDANPDDPNANAEQYVNADQVANWNNVISIRLTLTLNSQQVVSPGIGDGLLHKTYSTTIRLRNRSPA